TMHARRKADDQQLRLRIAEGRHRARVVTGVLLSHRGQKCGQTRTLHAIDVEHLSSTHAPRLPRAADRASRSRLSVANPISSATTSDRMGSTASQPPK